MANSAKVTPGAMIRVVIRDRVTAHTLTSYVDYHHRSADMVLTLSSCHVLDNDIQFSTAVCADVALIVFQVAMQSSSSTLLLGGEKVEMNEGRNPC